VCAMIEGEILAGVGQLILGLEPVDPVRGHHSIRPYLRSLSRAVARLKPKRRAVSD
jgi:hypothetical protein